MCACAPGVCVGVVCTQMGIQEHVGDACTAKVCLYLSLCDFRCAGMSLGAVVGPQSMAHSGDSGPWRLSQPSQVLVLLLPGTEEGFLMKLHDCRTNIQ